MSKKKILIHGGIVVNESSMAEQDIVIHGEKIVAICSRGECTSDQFDQVIDATGLYVLPGLVEPHVHFDAPFMGGRTDHDFHTGTKAAAFGGITTVISFSNQAKGESLISNLAYNENKAFGKAYVDWSLHGLLYDASEQTLSEIPVLVKSGIPTYKCFTTYRHSGRLMDDDGMLQVFKATADGGGMLMIHCENDAIVENRTKYAISHGQHSWIFHARSRPALAENVAIQRVVDLLKVEPAPVYIVHASTAESVQIIQEAQSQNLPIHCETCTHYLILTEELLNSEMGHLFICSPPLRTEKDNNALWTASKFGPIEVISSDDAGLPSELRTRLAEGRFDKVPNGMPGVEPRLTMLFTEGVLKNRISLPRLVQLTATNPARIFGLHPDKGSIAPGADADIVLFDPGVEWTMSAESLHMNTDFCPFAGRKVTGKPKTVLCRGKLVIQDFELVGSQAHGRRVFRKLDKTLLS